jgi:hypothetical protein
MKNTRNTHGAIAWKTPCGNHHIVEVQNAVNLVDNLLEVFGAADNPHALMLRITTSLNPFPVVGGIGIAEYGCRMSAGDIVLAADDEGIIYAEEAAPAPEGGPHGGDSQKPQEGVRLSEASAQLTKNSMGGSVLIDFTEGVIVFMRGASLREAIIQDVQEGTPIRIMEMLAQLIQTDKRIRSLFTHPTTAPILGDLLQTQCATWGEFVEKVGAAMQHAEHQHRDSPNWSTLTDNARYLTTYLDLDGFKENRRREDELFSDGEFITYEGVRYPQNSGAQKFAYLM